MDCKHFTFSRNDLPFSQSAVFQKIQIKIKKPEPCETHLTSSKRFALKNTINLEQVPPIENFQKNQKVLYECPIWEEDERDFDSHHKIKLQQLNKPKQKENMGCPHPKIMVRRSSRDLFKELFNQASNVPVQKSKTDSYKKQKEPVDSDGNPVQSKHNNLQAERRKNQRIQAIQNEINSKVKRNITSREKSSNGNSDSERGRHAATRKNQQKGSKHKSSKSSKRSNYANKEMKGSQFARKNEEEIERRKRHILDSMLKEVEEQSKKTKKLISVDKKWPYFMPSRSRKFKSLNNEKRKKKSTKRKEKGCVSSNQTSPNASIYQRNPNQDKSSSSFLESSQTNGSVLNEEQKRTQKQYFAKSSHSRGSQITRARKKNSLVVSSIKAKGDEGAEELKEDGLTATLRAAGSVLERYRVQYDLMKESKQDLECKYLNALRKLERIKKELEETE